MGTAVSGTAAACAAVSHASKAKSRLLNGISALKGHHQYESGPMKTQRMFGFVAVVLFPLGILSQTIAYMDDMAVFYPDYSEQEVAAIGEG